ncbi:MAG: sulfatase-like hydrolase/transferase, partial [Thermoguttaceae bacterium]
NQNSPTDSGEEAFFLYLATNTPHDPYTDVPLDKLEYYRKQAITPGSFPKTPGHPVRTELDVDKLARLYSMIENIDDNVGRLFDWLDREKLTGNTLVLFLTDNGPWVWGYNAGLRDHKTSPYEGGIRSPLLAHWPGRLRPGVCSDRIAAHIDLLPTLLNVCGVAAPAGLKLDGRSLLPLWERRPSDWPDRTLVFQMHRGDIPFRYHNCSVRSQDWKLVHATGFGTFQFAGPPKFELFDMTADPFETRDVAAEHPAVVTDLRQRYDRWFDEVGSTREENYAPLPIGVGTPHENPVVLTRQDWRGVDPPRRYYGRWLVDVAQAGSFDVTLRFKPMPTAATARFQLGGVQLEQPLPAGADEVVFRDVPLPAGPGWIEACLPTQTPVVGAMFVEIRQ